MAGAFRRWRKTAIRMDQSLRWCTPSKQNRYFLDQIRVGGPCFPNTSAWTVCGSKTFGGKETGPAKDAGWKNPSRDSEDAPRSGVKTSGSRTLQTILLDFWKIKTCRWWFWKDPWSDGFQGIGWTCEGLLHCLELHPWTLDSVWWPLQRLYFST